MVDLLLLLLRLLLFNYYCIIIIIIIIITIINATIAITANIIANINIRPMAINTQLLRNELYKIGRLDRT